MRTVSGPPAHQGQLPRQQQLRLAAQSSDVIHHLQHEAAAQPLGGIRTDTVETSRGRKGPTGERPEKRRHLCGPGLAVHPVHGLGAGVDGVSELLLHVSVGPRCFPDAGGRHGTHQTEEQQPASRLAGTQAQVRPRGPTRPRLARGDP